MTWTEANEALEQWRPSAARHDFHAAWDEAVQMVAREGRFLFLTDAEPDDTILLPKGMEVLALGEALPNVAFTAARWQPGEGAERGQIYLRIANLGMAAATVRVTAEAAGQSVLDRVLEMPPSSEAPLELAPPAELGQLTIRLSSDADALDIDNVVTLVEPKPRQVRIAVELQADGAESRLVERALRSLPGVVRVNDAAQADLIIGHAATATAAAATGDVWWLGIGPLNQSEAIRKQAVDLIGPYLIERQHPLLEGVSLGGIVWGGVQPTTEFRLSPLVSVDRTILMGRIEGGGAAGWVMNIDLARSNLGDSPDWPILLSNLVQMRRDALPGLRRWNYRLEEAVQLRSPALPTAAAAPDAAANDELTLLTPGGRERTLVRGRGDVIDIPPLGEPGVYEIRDGERLLERFAVNFFDREESTLLALSSVHIEPSEAYEATKINLDNPFSWLIVGAILLILLSILLDWQVLGGRGRSSQSGAAAI
ncbi:MAG: hypothetical protein R3B90_23285 [Planctomycetaceae bacterium]